MRRLVLGIAVAVTSLAPVVGNADDQQIADFIQRRLQAEQAEGNLKGFNIDMRVDKGTVFFDGHVANDQQESLIFKAAQSAGHLGVVQVVDGIDVKAPAATVAQPATTPATPVGYQKTQQAPAVPPVPAQLSGQGAAEAVVVTGEPLPFASSGGGPAALPVGHARPLPGQAVPGYPAAQGPAALPASYGPAASGSPNLPGYAWPAYAAHPNYGALSYPQQYSASAWPYIGPFYPYPQVPLGWRKVTLEWDDGFWHLDFKDK